jgi:uncharacterized protein (TIGR03437 family)
LAFLFVLPVNAQRVLLLPGASSTVSTFAADPFAAASSISATSGAFTILGNPAGSRFFVVSSSNVTVADNNGNPIQTLGVGLPITAAALTPDGRRLLVAAGTASAGSLYIFDLTGGTMVQSGAVAVGSNPTSVAADLDSSRAFVLTGSGLKSVDLAANTLTATLSLTGTTQLSEVVVGPNGLVYVNAPGDLYEIYPQALTIRKTIVMNAFPTKPLFTPDGTQALLVNLSASDQTEPALMVLNLGVYTFTETINYFGVTFNRLVWANSDQIYALSSQNRKLYVLPSNLGSIQEASLPAVGAIPTVISVFTSNEHPNTSGVPGPKYLFIVAPAALYRVDLNPPPGATPDQITKSLPLATLSPGGFYLAPASINSSVVTTIQYGDDQTLVPGTVSAPLVVQALDSLGRPIMNVPVTFAQSVGTVVSQMTATNADGLAEAIVQAPDTGEQMAVTATLLGAPAVVFTINPGGSGGGGGGGGTGASGIAIVSGSGQVIPGSSYAIEPLTVVVGDGHGNALPNIQVVFAVLGALGGSVSAPGCVPGEGGLVCTTNTDGQASVFFLAPPVSDSIASFVQFGITATLSGLEGAASQSVTFYETAVPQTAFGGQAGPIQAQRLLAPASPGDVISLQAGQIAPSAVRVQVWAQSGPFLGAAIPNVSLHMAGSRNPSEGVYDPSPINCVGGYAMTNASGIASCDLTTPSTTQAGTYQIYAIVAGNTGVLINVAVTAAPPPTPVATTATPASGNNQTGPVGQALPQPLVAIVRDQFGSPMAGVAVQWAVIAGSAQLATPTSTQTDSTGQASTRIVLGSTPGSVTVRMTAGSAAPAVFNLTATVTIGSLTKVSSTDNQSVVIGQAFQPLIVQVKDILNNPVGGIAVSFNVTSGVATPTSTVATTDNNGFASATFSATNTPGQIVVSASASGQSANFTLTARLPGPVLTAASFYNGASLQPGVPIGGVVAIKGVGLTTGLTIPPGSCISGTPDGNLERGLPTRLAGMEVWFSTRIAPIFAICVNADGTEQVNVQAPFELAPATITVLVKIGIGTAGEVDTYVPGVTVVAALPGIFEYNVDANTRIALAQRPDGTIVSPTNAAKAGETIRLYVTGIGWVLDSTRKQVQTNQPGYPGQLPWDVTTSVTLNNAGTSGVTAEYAENLIGVFVVSFQVPAQNASATIPIFVSATPLGQQTINSLVSHIPVSQ